MSILDNNAKLAAAVNDVAEVAGYLWQKGWAERNGGNITVNITDCVTDAMRAMEPITEAAGSTAKAHRSACATSRAVRWTTDL